MRIYLLNPPYLPHFVRGGRWPGSVARSGALYYPIWLAYTTGILEESYQDVRLVDAPATGWDLSAVMDDAKRFKPDLMVLDTNFASLSNDISVARSLKGATNATTVLVGPPASQLAQKMLQNEGVDIVARFEYDFTLRDIAQAIEDSKDWSSIRGISFKKDGSIINNPDRSFIPSQDLDTIPFVSRVYQKHLNIRDYFLGNSLYPMVQIFTGRGCPHHCTFCSWPETLMGRELRTRSVANVVDELEYVRKEMPQVREVFFEDDTFTIDKRRVAALCDEILRRRLHLVWSCNARGNLDYETMRQMKAAGCRLLIVGYESGSEHILRNIKKGITLEQARKFTRDAKRAGLMVLGDFIIGLPGETRETAEQTIRLIKELRPNLLQVAVATPIPGTEFYRWAEENGFLLTRSLDELLDAQGYQRCIVSYPGLSDKEIESYVDRALKTYYLAPAYVPVALANILRRNWWQELRVMTRMARFFFKYLGRGR